MKTLTISTYTRDILITYEGVVDLSEGDLLPVVTSLCTWLSSFDDGWNNPLLPPEFRKHAAISKMATILISKGVEPLYPYVVGLLSRYAYDMRYVGNPEPCATTKVGSMTLVG